MLSVRCFGGGGQIDKQYDLLFFMVSIAYATVWTKGKSNCSWDIELKRQVTEALR